MWGKKRKRILVVDDDEFIRATCLMILTGAGHDVTVTVNGVAALEKLKTSEFDLVVADLEMPLLDGIGLYQHAAKDYPYIADKFLFITGRLTPKSHDILTQLNKIYLLKPFNVKEFLRHVDMVLPHT